MLTITIAIRPATTAPPTPQLRPIQTPVGIPPSSCDAGFCSGRASGSYAGRPPRLGSGATGEVSGAGVRAGCTPFGRTCGFGRTGGLEPAWGFGRTGACAWDRGAAGARGSSGVSRTGAGCWRGGRFSTFPHCGHFACLPARESGPRDRMPQGQETSMGMKLASPAKAIKPEPRQLANEPSVRQTARNSGSPGPPIVVEGATINVAATKTQALASAVRRIWENSLPASILRPHTRSTFSRTHASNHSAPL